MRHPQYPENSDNTTSQTLDSPVSDEPLQHPFHPQVDAQNEALANLLKDVIANELALSRTTSGVYDRSTSQSKPDIAISGNELHLKALANLEVAYTDLYASRSKTFSNGAEIKQFFDYLLRTTHADIFHHDFPKLRTWNPPYTKYDFTKLPEALAYFYEEYFQRLHSGGNELENYSWATRSFDTELHPYGDGCGRLSRLHGSFFLIRSNLPLPLFDSRDSYYRAMSSSCPDFSEYVRNCAAF